MGLDECMKMSLFAVIDGHGGDWCAHFMRKRLEREIRK
jgi:serine/threonine protein phosphatase PrpC